MTSQVRPEADWILIDAPAIVPAWQFNQAKMQLAENLRAFVGRPPARVALLRGLLRCGLCGRNYGPEFKRGALSLYRCNTKRRYDPTACDSTSRRAEVLDVRVWEAVTGLLRQPDALARVAEAQQVKVGVRDVDVQSERTHLARLIADCQKQERRLLDLYLEDDGEPSESVRVRLHEIAARRRTLQAWAQEVETAVVAEALAARTAAVREFCRQAVRGLDNLDAAGRATLLKTIVVGIVLHDDRTEINMKLGGLVAGDANRSEVHDPRAGHRDGGAVRSRGPPRVRAVQGRQRRDARIDERRGPHAVAPNGRGAARNRPSPARCLIGDAPRRRSFRSPRRRSRARPPRAATASPLRRARSSRSRC